jgi:hypothetical protein
MPTPITQSWFGIVVTRVTAKSWSKLPQNFELGLKKDTSKRGRIDISPLLNPAGKSQVLTETTDAEIYQAVTGAIEARDIGETVDVARMARTLLNLVRPERDDVIQASRRSSS